MQQICRAHRLSSQRKVPSRPTPGIERRHRGVPPTVLAAGAGRRHVLSLKSAAKRSDVDDASATTTSVSAATKTVIAVERLPHVDDDDRRPESHAVLAAAGIVT